METWEIDSTKAGAGQEENTLPWWVQLLPQPSADPESLRWKDAAFNAVMSQHEQRRHVAAQYVWAIATRPRLSGVEPLDGDRYLIHTTGTFIGKGASTSLASAYRARHAVNRVLGLDMAKGSELEGCPDPKAHYPIVCLAVQLGCGMAARALWEQGILSEVCSSDEPEQQGVPAILPPLLAGRIKCPFHEERNPSLNIRMTPKGPVFKCFGCGAAGVYSAGKLFLSKKSRDARREASQAHLNGEGGGENNKYPSVSPAPLSGELPAPLRDHRPLQPVRHVQRPAIRLPVPPRPREVAGGRVGMALAGQERLPRFRALAGSTDRAAVVRRGLYTPRHSEAHRAIVSAPEGRWLDQHYESVGLKGCDPERDMRETRDGRRFPGGFSVACGTDRVVIDIDRMGRADDERPDGSDPGLLDVLRLARARAELDPRLVAVDLVETSDDGVQAHLWLASPACSGPEELALYADPTVSAWGQEWARWLLKVIGRGGEVDGSVWRAGGYCRALGWRRCTRSGRVFRARYVDEVELRETFPRQRAPKSPPATRKRGELAAGEGLSLASEAAVERSEEPDGYRLPPTPYRAAEAIVAAVGGRPWKSADGRRVRVYLEGEAHFIELPFAGQPLRYRGPVAQDLQLRARIEAAAASAPVWREVTAEQVNEQARALSEALKGSLWLSKDGRTARVYLSPDRASEEERPPYLQICAGDGLLTASGSVEPFQLRRAASLLRELRSGG